MRPLQPSTAILFRKSRDKSLSNHLAHALRSYPEELPSRSVDRVCHTLGPKPKLSLYFQTTFPTAMAHTPSRLWPLEPHRRSVPGLSKETVPIPLATTLPIKRKLQDPRGHPNSVRLPWTHRGNLTQAVQLPPLRHTDGCPQGQKIEPDRPLGPHLNPHFGFQASLLRGMVSNTSIWGFPVAPIRTPLVSTWESCSWVLCPTLWLR